MDDLSVKIDNLAYQFEQSKAAITDHPVLFTGLLIGFFITMDLWASATNSFLNRIHPRGVLKWWEYLILAILALFLLVWIGGKKGIQIRMLGGE